MTNPAIAVAETPSPPEMPVNPKPEPEIMPPQPDTATPEGPQGPEIVPDRSTPEVDPPE